MAGIVAKALFEVEGVWWLRNGHWGGGIGEGGGERNKWEDEKSFQVRSHLGPL